MAETALAIDGGEEKVCPGTHHRYLYDKIKSLEIQIEHELKKGNKNLSALRAKLHRKKEEFLGETFSFEDRKKPASSSICLHAAGVKNHKRYSKAPPSPSLYPVPSSMVPFTFTFTLLPHGTCPSSTSISISPSPPPELMPCIYQPDDALLLA